MQAQTQIQVGDIYANGVGDQMLICAINFQTSEISYKVLNSPGLDPNHVFTIPLHLFTSVTKIMSPPSYLGLPSQPNIGDSWTFIATGEVVEVLGVTQTNGVHIRTITPINSPSFYVSIVDFMTKYAFLGRTLLASPPKLQGLSVPGGFNWRSGGSQALPSGTPLPPGESNEFFGISMTNILNKCTCGIDSIGGGKHSDWCDKHEEEEKT